MGRGLRFPTARFHVESGPASLFERVRYILRGPTSLKITEHFADQGARRRAANALRDSFKEFRSADWEVMTADVSVDSGKFVASAWRRTFGDHTWWIVIGLGNAVQTVFMAKKHVTKSGGEYVREGALFEKVEKVNRDLMAEVERQESPPQ